MKRTFCLALLSLTSLWANTLTVSSSQAVYEGEQLHLTGEVELTHPLGLLSSHEALLKKGEASLSLPFSFAFLEKNVKIAFKNNASLSCEQASFHFDELKGHLTGTEEKVVYQDTICDREGQSNPFTLTSHEVDITLQETSPSLYQVDTLLAQKEVIIHYGQNLELKAEEALYEREQGKETVRAYTLSPSHPCELSRHKERIEASSIYLDLQEKTLLLRSPVGQLASSLKEQEGEMIHFACQELLWKEEADTLTLKESVVIEQPILGRLIAEKEVIITKKGPVLQSIAVPGRSTLVREGSLLTCPSSLYLDGEKGHITAFGLKDQEQVSYKDDKLCLLGDQARFSYNSPSPSLVMRGQCYLTSQDGTQRALADKLTYLPETETLILSAHPNKTVLFYDASEQVAMSAEQVKVTKDPITKKIHIKGAGNMKLTLSKEEEALLQPPSHYPPRRQP